MIETLEKLSNGYQVPLDELFKFIKFVWCKNNPDQVYNEDLTVKLYQNGYINKVVEIQINMIFEDPDKYGVSIMKVYNKQGNLIRVYVKSN